MASIDAQNLQLSASGNVQQQLYQQIRERIIQGQWSADSRLPATRLLAQQLNISRNSVIYAYKQLQAEGYLRSHTGSGYYVALTLPEQQMAVSRPLPTDAPAALAPWLAAEHFCLGMPDMRAFPYRHWQRLIAEQQDRFALAGYMDLQGYPPLRQVLAQYLRAHRAVNCHADQLIITSGAQQALYLACALVFNAGDEVLLENPGYISMRCAMQAQRLKISALPVEPERGLCLQQLQNSQAKGAYLCPSNQYPLGTHVDAQQRLLLLDWAKSRGAWLIEDDYDSEFQYQHRPYPALQGMVADAPVLYVGTFSKTLLPALRLGYLWVPDALREQALMLKRAMGGASPSVSQAALAQFIQSGAMLRHIRKMRHLYHHKFLLLQALVEQELPSEVRLVSQAAGMHATLIWPRAGIAGCAVSELLVVAAFKAAGHFCRGLSDYLLAATELDYQGICLGFANASDSELRHGINDLGQVFRVLMQDHGQ